MNRSLGGSPGSRTTHGSWSRGPYGTPTLYRINFGVLVVLLLINGAYSYQANRELIRNESRVQNTQNVLAAIKDTFSALQDAETASEGTSSPEGIPSTWSLMIQRSRRFDHAVKNYARWTPNSTINERVSKSSETSSTRRWRNSPR